MSESIKDGTGKCNLARVDEKNRLHTGSVTRTEKDAAIHDGRFFVANTQVITLTDDSETPMIYWKNDGEMDLYLDSFIISAGNSTDGVGNSYLRSWGNVDDTSSIVTEAKETLIGNTNLASSKQFDGDVFKGETGDTFTGGINFSTFIFDSPAYRFEPLASILPKGTSGMFSFQPPVGNTSQEVIITVLMYYIDENLPK